MNERLPVEPPNPIDAPAPPRKSWRAIAMKSSVYEVISLVAQNVIRLASNLALTRLLFPEAFGLAALVNIFNQGLAMLSDVGIAPSVTQSPRGDDPEFLDTAWTLQVIRGVTLTVLGLVAAWPVSLVYGEPLLAPLLAVGSLTSLVHGFASTSMMSMRRHVDSKGILIVDLGSQIFSLLVMVPAAWYMRSVWALMLGLHAGAFARTFLSYAVPGARKNGFRYSKEAADSIVHLGKWILFGSVMTFVSQQADRLLLGKFLGMRELGIYNVAVMFADLGSMVALRLGGDVLFPIMSRIHGESPHRVRDVYYKARLVMDGLSLPAAGLGCVLAPWFISLLYDARYQEAGWMLRILTIRLIFSAIVTPGELCLLAAGSARYGFHRSLLRMIWTLLALPIGYHFYGLPGLVWATALAESMALFVILPAFAKHGLLRLERELLVPALFGAGAGVGWVVLTLFSLG